jgi:hypothetical protein
MKQQIGLPSDLIIGGKNGCSMLERFEWANGFGIDDL